MIKTIITSGTPATANITSASFRRQFNENSLSVKYVSASFNAFDATIEVEESDDDSTFYTNAGNKYTIEANGSYGFTITGLASEYYRLKYLKVSNSAGTLGATINLSK